MHMQKSQVLFLFVDTKICIKQSLILMNIFVCDANL